MQNFKQRLQRGAIGEEIVRRRLRAAGHVLYSPDPDQRHLIDGFAWSERIGLFAFEVKTYAARRYHSDTGVNKEHWKQYVELRYRMPIMLCWVDPQSNLIYCQRVDKLLPHARTEGEKVYFPLEQLAILGQLTDKEMAQLSNTPQRIVIEAGMRDCDPKGRV